MIVKDAAGRTYRHDPYSGTHYDEPRHFTVRHRVFQGVGHQPQPKLPLRRPGRMKGHGWPAVETRQTRSSSLEDRAGPRHPSQQEGQRGAGAGLQPNPRRRQPEILLRWKLHPV